MNVPILTVPEHRWECPSCGQQATTRRSDVHTEFHHCPKLGVWAPMVEFTGDTLDLSTVRHRLVEREDYVGDEDVRYPAVMAVDTERADGSNDRAVFAPTAHGG